MKKKTKSKNILACSVLRKHFGKIPLENLITTRRTLPLTSRVDLQLALNEAFSKRYKAKLIGVHPYSNYEPITFMQMTRDNNYPVLVGPLQYDDIDIGETLSARCLKHGLWLSKADK